VNDVDVQGGGLAVGGGVDPADELVVVEDGEREVPPASFGLYISSA